MTARIRAGKLAAAALLASASIVSAQSVVDFAGEPRVRLGPFGLTPTIVLQGAGIDNNVFNEPDDPKQDLTGVVSPSAEVWFRAGRVGARLHNTVSLVYFRRFTNQRGIDLSHDATISVRAGRITPYMTAQYVDTHERPSVEIDTRARRQNVALGGGLSASIGARLTVQLEAKQQRTTFADDALFEGVSLRALLNETATSWTGSARWDLTPLTRIAVDVQRQEDRFALTPSRNAQSVRIASGVEFAPSALVSGHASAGVRRFRSADRQVPPFTGMVGSVDLSYTLRGRTRFTIRADRDLAYSFSQSAPYYLLTSFGGDVTRRFRQTWDVTASATRQRLAYRTVGLAAPPAPDGTPRPIGGIPEGSAQAYGLGAGFRFARNSRLGFHADYSARPAGLGGEFRNLRYFTTVTYAF